MYSHTRRSPVHALRRNFRGHMGHWAYGARPGPFDLQVAQLRNLRQTTVSLVTSDSKDCNNHRLKIPGSIHAVHV